MLVQTWVDVLQVETELKKKIEIRNSNRVYSINVKAKECEMMMRII